MLLASGDANISAFSWEMSGSASVASPSCQTMYGKVFTLFNSKANSTGLERTHYYLSAWGQPQRLYHFRQVNLSGGLIVILVVGRFEGFIPPHVCQF